MTVIDLFSGPGGWATGAAGLGLSTIGVELDRDACRTHAAAGHLTIRADVATFPFDRLRIDGLIVSPPCPDFSLAGKGAGIDGETGKLMHEVPRWVETLRPRWVACEQVPPALEWWERFAHTFRGLGYRTWCGILNAADYGVPQTRRRAFLLASLDYQPRPPEATHGRDPQPQMFGEPILPWVSMASALGWGITDSPCLTVTGGGTETGGAEPVSHPKRAAATAARGSWVEHRRGGDRIHEGIDPDETPRMTITSRTDRWVVRTGANSMVTGREAHDIQPYERSVDEPAPTLDAKAGSAWSVRTNNVQSGEPGTRHEQPLDQTAPTVTSRADLWTLHTNRDQRPDGSRQTRDGAAPAPALTAKAGGQWAIERPATTVCGDPRLGSPGHRDREGGERQFGEHAIKLTVRDALILQSFPADYPVQGTKTSAFRQIGNAVPPALARAVLAAVCR